MSYVIETSLRYRNPPNIQEKKWVNDITNILIEIPRSIPTCKESVTSADLYVFEDASIVANCAAFYAVVNQPSAISQCLVTSLV